MNNNNVLTGQLISHLGLTGDPFADSLSVFFEGSQRQHNIETLRHMSSFGDMVLLVTGEKGAGKTSLLKRFSVEADELNVLYIPSSSSAGAESSVSAIKLLEKAAGLSKVQGETVQQTFARVIQSLEQTYAEEKTRSVIVIDDADLLSKKELQFYLSGFKAMSIDSGVVGVFAGLPGLIQKARLSCDYDEEEWLHQIQLRPLGSSECLEYVQLRLEAVGYKDSLDLSDVQLAHLAESGKGLPGRINRMFSSVLLEPGSLRVEKVNNRSSLPKVVLITLVFLLGFSFLFVAYQYGMFDAEENSLVQEQKTPDVMPDHEESLAIQQKKARLAMLDKAISESLPDRELANKAVVEPASPVVENEAFEKESIKAPIKEAVKATVDEQKGIESTADESLAHDRTAEREVVQTKAAASKDRVLADKSESALDDKKVQAIASDRSLAKEDSSPEDESVKRESSSAKLVQTVVEQAVPFNKFFRSKSWVQAKPKGTYGAQVLGSHNEKTAQNFAEKISKSDQEVYYLETLYKGKSWYVVFYGVFESKAQANKVLKNAPNVIRRQQPWLRSFEAVLKSYPK